MDYYAVLLCAEGLVGRHDSGLFHGFDGVFGGDTAFPAMHGSRSSTGAYGTGIPVDFFRWDLLVESFGLLHLHVQENQV